MPDKIKSEQKEFTAMLQKAFKSGGGARKLLARLRDIMAGSGSAEDRLNKIVSLIAADMQAEVCSCYVMRQGGILELFATVGLRQEAVHKTRLRIDEGIVGEIAARALPIALSNAKSHPSFAYRPETGEDEFNSIMGVPLLRGGKVRGVVVVQNIEKRHYSEYEVEMLETIAMILAELVSGGSLMLPEEAGNSEGNFGLVPSHIQGQILNKGLAFGNAVLHRPQIMITEMVAEETDEELIRLDDSIVRMHRSLDKMLADNKASGIGGEHHEILETYKMFAEDRGWIGRIREAINTGLTAEAAVARVQDENRARLSQVSDHYLRDRLYDLEDLTNRLLYFLAGEDLSANKAHLPDDAIIVARNMGPADLLEYNRNKIKGLVLEEGSGSSHVAIVARALNIPVISGIIDAMSRIKALDEVIIDGDHGQIMIRPSEDIIEAYRENIRVKDMRELLFRGVKKLPARTMDGVDIEVLINAGLQIDMQQLHNYGAVGVGLYRTEIPFMMSNNFPSVNQQMKIYRDILELSGGKPVAFRTLDIGGDKALPYMPSRNEENPALGWRAIRMGLDRPALLKKQLRALVRAAAGYELRVTFPMISQVWEFKQAKIWLLDECERAKKEGFEPPIDVKAGAMIEVPSILWQMPELLEVTDYISLGSNDLAQYFYAADRGDIEISQRFDSLSIAFLRALAALSNEAKAAKVPLSVCGEMASRPIDALALLALGYRSLSVSPHAVGRVKTMICSLDLARLQNYVSQSLKGRDRNIRSLLDAYARDHDVVLDD